MSPPRLWDFDRDEHYLLELTSVGQVPQTAHVTYIDYNKVKGEGIPQCSCVYKQYRHTECGNQLRPYCDVAVLSIQE